MFDQRELQTLGNPIPDLLEVSPEELTSGIMT